MTISRFIRTTSALVALMLGASCGPSPNAPGVGGVTKAQAEELNQAAEALDGRANDAQSAALQRQDSH